MNATVRLDRRPEARSYTVERLLELVEDGRLRVPDFQRPLKWKGADILDLFDSIYRGFPIGELLLSRGPAPAGRLRFGPVAVEAAESSDALHIVDGQQRLTSLAGVLLHPDQAPRIGDFAVWFDLESDSFQRPGTGQVPDSWIPLNVLGDSVSLLQWLHAWPHRERRPDLVRLAIELGKAIREYQIPAYVVESATEQQLRLIFKRVNTSGKQLEANEVFDALYGRAGAKPISMACDRLSASGFGRFDRELFLRCLKAVEGRRGSDALDEAGGPEVALAVQRTEEALTRAVQLLVDDAGILHRSLLPYRLPLVVLARFFRLFPEPTARNRALLARWVWRGALNGQHASSSIAVVDELCSLLEPATEDLSTQSLLRSISAPLQAPDIRATWHGRTAATRLCALALVGQQPRDPETGEPFRAESIRASLEERDAAGTFIDLADDEGGHAPILRRALFVGDAHPLLLRRASAEVLGSHLLDQEAMQALAAGELGRFQEARAPLMTRAFERFFSTKAALDASDRPRIAWVANEVDAVLDEP